jgi:hypothetical protein
MREGKDARIKIGFVVLGTTALDATEARAIALNIFLRTRISVISLSFRFTWYDMMTLAYEVGD